MSTGKVRPGTVTTGQPLKYVANLLTSSVALDITAFRSLRLYEQQCQTSRSVAVSVSSTVRSEAQGCAIPVAALATLQHNLFQRMTMPTSAEH
jgi:hypothetical protein